MMYRVFWALMLLSTVYGGSICRHGSLETTTVDQPATGDSQSQCNDLNSEYILNIGCDLCMQRAPNHPFMACATAPKMSCVCRDGFARENPGSSCIPVNQCKIAQQS